ncbi:hypothetical protein ACLB1R_35140 [Escherichia coli]
MDPRLIRKVRVVEVASFGKEPKASLSKTWSLVVRTGRRHPALMESVEGIVLFPDGFANMGN